MEESFFIRQEHNNNFQNKIDIIQRYDGDNFSFCYCRFGFEMETEVVIPDIREDGIVDEPQTIKISHALPFWIADNNFILFKSLGNTYNKKGKALLSNHLFDDEEAISENTFDIDAITNAVEEGYLTICGLVHFQADTIMFKEEY